MPRPEFSSNLLFSLIFRALDTSFTQDKSYIFVVLIPKYYTFVANSMTTKWPFPEPALTEYLIIKLSPPFFSCCFILLINLTTFLWSHDAVSRHAVFELYLIYTQY